MWEERRKWIESGRNGGARRGREDSEMGGGNGCGKAPPAPGRMRRRRPGLRTGELSPTEAFHLNKRQARKPGLPYKREKTGFSQIPPSKNCGVSRKKNSSPSHDRKRSGSLFSGGVAQRFLPGQSQKTRRVPPEFRCRAAPKGHVPPAGVFFTGRSRKRNALPARVFRPSRFSSAPCRGRARLLSFCAAAHRSPARRAPPQSP